jgi:hypothetical protein
MGLGVRGTGEARFSAGPRFWARAEDKILGNSSTCGERLGRGAPGLGAKCLDRSPSPGDSGCVAMGTSAQRWRRFVGPLFKDDRLRLLDAFHDELQSAGVKGHVQTAGGAVMCLAFDARASGPPLGSPGWGRHIAARSDDSLNSGSREVFDTSFGGERRQESPGVDPMTIGCHPMRSAVVANADCVVHSAPARSSRRAKCPPATRMHDRRCECIDWAIGVSQTPK